MQNDKKAILKQSISNVTMQNVGRKISDLDCCSPISSKKGKKDKERMIYPPIYLDNSETPYLDDCEVGETYSFLVEGVVRSKSSSESIDHKPMNSYTLEIHKIGKA